MSIFRAITLAAGIVGGGVALARDRLDKEIEKKIDARIDQARDEAIADLDNAVQVFVRRQFLTFTRNLGVKAGVVSLVVGGRLLSLYDRGVMGWLILACLVGFLIFDAVNIWPNAKLMFGHAKRAKWNLLQALRNLVAAEVFDKAYSHVMEETKDKKVKYWIAVSRYNPEKISTHIADALSQVAAAASVGIVRTRAGVVIARMAAMMAIYSAVVTYVMLVVH